MKKKILTLVVIVAMFLLVSAVDTIDNTSANDITNSQIQAQINMESRGR